MNSASLTNDDAELFRALFNTAPDAMIVVDHEGRIVLANPQAERMFGYGDHELPGLHVEALLPERVRLAHQSHRSSYMANPRVRPMGAGYELTGIRRNGQSFPVEIGLSPIDGANQALFAASIRDISETQRARQALVRARYDAAAGQVSRLLLESPSYEQAVDSMPSLVASALKAESALILFRDAHAHLWNCRASQGSSSALQQRICRELSEANEETMGQRYELNGSDTDEAHPTFSSIRNALLEEGFVDAAMVPLPDRNEPMGLLLVLARESGGFDHDKMHFLQSVANMLAAAVQRSRSEEQLAHAQRLDAIGQLTGGIAHDFNNLLTIISGNLQLLSATVLEDELSREAMDSATRAADRCAALTSKLLSFASRRRLKPQALTPAQLLVDLREMLARTLGERIAISMTCPDDLPAIDVDPSEFDTALVNLAINARDAMPRGGRLDISVHLERLTAAPNGKPHIVFCIHDTGLGMTPEVLAHALEPFFTTKDVGKGSGLGLSMVYGFIRQSGGHMTIDSQLGYGTRVDLSFPATTSAPATLSEPSPPVHSGRETILVVEDEPEVRRVALAFLRSLGYSTLEAEGADEALSLLMAHRKVDLLFSDVVLGHGMTGVELAEAVRRLHPAMPVLLTSGYEGRTPAVNEAALKDFALIPKPYRKEDLAEAIYRTIRSSYRS